MSDTKRQIQKWPKPALKGSKRTHVEQSAFLDGDWFVGYGKSQGCQFEGTWWDMICFARNVLASENTKLAAPEFYQPALANDNYTGPAPYEFEEGS